MNMPRNVPKQPKTTIAIGQMRGPPVSPRNMAHPKNSAAGRRHPPPTQPTRSGEQERFFRFADFLAIERWSLHLRSQEGCFVRVNLLQGFRKLPVQRFQFVNQFLI